MSISDTQAQLFGELGGNSATIDTSGRTIRPMVEIPSAVVNVSRVNVAPGELTIDARDPSNVAYLHMLANTSVFDDFTVDTDELVVGVNYDRLETQLANARMGKRTDDPVELAIDQTRTLVMTEREYSQTTLTQTNEVLNVDPDTIRDVEPPGELGLPFEATVDVTALIDALDSVGRVSNHAIIRERDAQLVIAAKDDDTLGEYGTVANFGSIVHARNGTVPEGEVASKFSLEYLSDMAAGLHAGKVDDVTLAWGADMPLVLNFERTIGDETAYRGEYLLAPRVST